MADPENTLIVTNDPIAEVITPHHVRELMRVSQATGCSLSATLNRAVDRFLNVEAPAQIARAGHSRRQDI
jgi:hypothetical protein